MYITNTTDDYNICTNNDKNNEIIIPYITIIPCAMSLICLRFLMMYTLIKPLVRKNYFE